MDVEEINGLAEGVTEQSQIGGRREGRRMGGAFEMVRIS